MLSGGMCAIYCACTVLCCAVQGGYEGVYVMRLTYPSVIVIVLLLTGRISVQYVYRLVYDSACCSESKAGVALEVRRSSTSTRVLLGKGKGVREGRRPFFCRRRGGGG